MTNADRIRAMSNEGMACERVRFNMESNDYTTSDGCVFEHMTGALVHELEWLLSEAEEEW